MTDSDPAALKRAAAVRALDFVQSGMKVGLGTGSTAEAFLEVLAPRVHGDFKITGVATSERTAQKARALGIVMADLDGQAPLDLTIDGADEADRDLNLIKGGGGAHLREKIVATSSKKMVVIVDSSKLVEKLGRFPLPVEVSTFGHKTTAARIASAIAKLKYSNVAMTLRGKDGAPFKTDGGNYIYDCGFGAITDAPRLAEVLSVIPGVIEHGLFIGIASALVVAGPGGVDVIERK
ncbi:MAG TPA: ribose-5-phosphate isomerase RpiA [Rhizomicrobium sp.]|jgi:ribose 5-phosphate isomerase A|nr:ribose-5-phosphate isomerase RpiA [Rhizomicrobium sp.]